MLDRGTGSFLFGRMVESTFIKRHLTILYVRILWIEVTFLSIENISCGSSEGSLGDFDAYGPSPDLAVSMSRA